MSLHIESFYQENQLPTLCVICGRSTSGRFSPPVRHVLVDGDEKLGDVCERCAYGSIDLWRVALIEYAIRLETKAATLRALAARVYEAEPAPEGIAEDIVRDRAQRPGPNRPPFPPFRFGD
jgi:hypothetical protein